MKRQNLLSFLIFAFAMYAASFYGYALACSDSNRSSTVRRQFQKLHPCPSTGQRTGSCPGYIADHIVALCVGGIDDTSNMQWQTVADASAKDKVECKKKPAKK